MSVLRLRQSCTIDAFDLSTYLEFDDWSTLLKHMRPDFVNCFCELAKSWNGTDAHYEIIFGCFGTSAIQPIT